MPTRDEQMTHQALQEGGRAVSRYLPQLVKAVDNLTEQLVLLNDRLRERENAAGAGEDDERVPRGDV